LVDVIAIATRISIILVAIHRGTNNAPEDRASNGAADRAYARKNCTGDSTGRCPDGSASRDTATLTVIVIAVIIIAARRRRPIIGVGSWPISVTVIRI
jgi:hypothetical protein